MERVQVSKIEPGDVIETALGVELKVLSSNPERQSAASASFGVWEIQAYREGEPTWSTRLSPNDEITRVRKAGDPLTAHCDRCNLTLPPQTPGSRCEGCVRVHGPRAAQHRKAKP